MTLVLSWDNHNRLLQADQVVAYDDGDTGLEAGQQTVVEWRYRADPGDDWGDPVTHTISGTAASYDPPAAGWVQIAVYSVRGGLVSWQPHVGVVQVNSSGEPTAPKTRITETGDRRVTESGDVRVTE